MPARKTRQTEEQESQEAQTEEEAAPIFALEPVTEELRSQLNVWGNATLLCIQMVGPKYPGWAEMIQVIFDTVKESIEVFTA